MRTVWIGTVTAALLVLYAPRLATAAATASPTPTHTTLPAGPVATPTVLAVAPAAPAAAASGVAATNVAQGRPASQSSTAAGGVASRAVDGNTDGNWAAGSVTHTGSQAGSWWEVDLGGFYDIASIEIWNRTDCCSARLDDYYVLVSNAPSPQPGAAGVFQHFESVPAGRPTSVAVNRRGRYVRIQKAGSGVISLAEVEVWGTPATEPLNLALQRPATQSSTAAGGVASRAVDGNSSGNFAQGSVTHTNYDPAAWWQVDLGAQRRIDEIRIWNRTDCCAARLSDYYVLVSATPDPQPGAAGVFARLETAPGGTPTTVAVGRLGRYVRILKQGAGVVSLAEVEVLGGDAAVLNAALAKTAVQSSTAVGGVAARAVDGNTDGTWANGSTTHTSYDQPAWWEVDLGAVVDVAWVDVWNRSDCCGDRLSNYFVMLSADPAPQPGASGIFERFESAAAGSPTTIPVAASGRYLRIQKAGAGVVSLAEVQVWVAAPGTADAAYVGQLVSPVLTAGETATVAVRLRNTGDVAWSTAGGYELAPVGAPWGVTAVPLAAGESIAAGEEKTFSFAVTAPTQLGTYPFQWRLRAGAAWVGESSPSVAVAVVAPRDVSPYALRFAGTGSGDVDRVKIRLDDPAVAGDSGPPADVGGEDFTLELWLKGSAADNDAAAQACGDNVNWIYGNIVVDRDRFDQGRKFGLSIAGGAPIFGVSGAATHRTICATTTVVDDQWHHVAVQRRRSDGRMWLYVDGQLEAEADGPDGDVSYPDDGVPCATCCGGASCDFSDPFLVIGAEKHDADPDSFPSFAGLVDEVRLSNALRYAASFTPPAAPFAADAATVALYHFDEGNGDRIIDSSGAAGGPSPGERRVGGAPPGPLWSIDTPFPAAPTVGTTALATAPGTVVAIANAGDHRLFLATRSGRVLVHDGAQIRPAPFLDIEALVDDGTAERGLLGLAFHPDYLSNGFFFVNYTDAAGDTVIARYRRSAGDADLADAGSGVTLLGIDQPFINHNGGQLAFGDDGMLYIGMGDGGDSGNPTCSAQRDDSLLGKMLRIDVDQNADTPPHHGIPADNPYVGPGDPRDEIWAEGLRNPWRFTFDRLTAAMFIADVGQRAMEEVSYQKPGAGGANYGWKVMEGSLCYIEDCPNGASNCNADNCPADLPPCGDPSLQPPILEYPHSLGCSVTGGYVYRGRRHADLVGAYLYADFCSGRLWAGRHDDGAWGASQLATATGNVYTFGEDSAGEVYLSNGTTIFRLGQ